MTGCPPEGAFADLLAGRLAEGDTARLRRHVEACDACRDLLDALAKGATAEAEAARAAEADPDGAIAREMLRGGAPAPTMASLAGTTLDGKYELVRLLGEGGMGSVFEGRHVGTGRRVAVKLVNARLLALSDDARRRFRREAKAAGGVDSPHIVAVLDSGEDEMTGDLYLVMEYLRGEDLQRLIERAGPLPPDVALRVAAQALVGLAKAHEAGVVHRDVKPANLFLARHGDGEVTVKVLDFGIAKITADAVHVAQSSGLTDTGALLGSPLYMSPEQVQSSKDVDHRTDLWSLGSALYCALAGRAPFSHVESVVKLILAICGSAPPKIRDRAPWVPGEVAAVVDRALATDRDRRYPSAAAMLDAIRALLPDGFALREEALVGLSPEARSRHVVSTGGGSEVSGDGATVAQDTRAGSPATRARTVAILALLLGAGAAALYASRPGPSPRAAAPSASEPPAPATAPAPAAPATASAEPSAQAPRGAPPPPPAPVTGPAPRKPPVPPAPRPSAAPSARPDASKPGGGFF